MECSDFFSEQMGLYVSISVIDYKEIMIFMSEIITTETVHECPNCGHSDFVKDYDREELYCNHCGLVLQSAVQSVGLENCEFAIPYSPPSEVRRKWLYSDDKGKLHNEDITNYRHKIPNWKLMKKGRSIRQYRHHNR